MQNGSGLTQNGCGREFFYAHFARNYIFSPPNLQYLPTPMHDTVKIMSISVRWYSYDAYM